LSAGDEKNGIVLFCCQQVMKTMEYVLLLSAGDDNIGRCIILLSAGDENNNMCTILLSAGDDNNSRFTIIAISDHIFQQFVI
jgi:hypothetical protein